MKRVLPWITVLSIVSAIGLPACMSRRNVYTFQDSSLARYQSVATEIEYPNVATPSNAEAASTMAPITIPTGPDDPEPVYWNLPLEEAVQISLQNSSVLRDLGGLVLQSPGTVKTIEGPAIQETDPRFGVDAALSAFDANLTGSAFFEKNDRALNNQFFGGGTRLLKQDLHAYRLQLSKRTGYGGEVIARHTADYDFNNAPGNQFPSAWTVFLEAEARQPLLQGVGAQYNQIAGPGAIPGLYNGVLVARINTDISLADFEMGVRNMVNDVEIAYWELYFAYRDLDTKLAARDRALRTWRIIRAWFEEDRRGGEADKEAQAREQYYRLEEEVQNALTGRLEDRIRVTVFRGQGGVQQAERRLRLLMGAPITDGRLIRPEKDPQMARVVFQWEDVLEEALTRREELRRQRWLVKRRELELLASRNFLLPRLDAIGRYRWRGFGQDLISANGGTQFDNAWADLLTGDFQEWQLGVEFAAPIGGRRGHAAVRNAQLNLSRERTVLDEQEREVAHDLSNAIGEMDRAYVVAQTNFNRRLAAQQQFVALELKFESPDATDIPGTADFFVLLDAQRKLAEAESKYFRSMIEYELAVKNVHYQKGSLLDYDGVFLSEGAWPNKAYNDAAIKARSRTRGWNLTDYTLNRRPQVVSQGPTGTVITDGYGPESFTPAEVGLEPRAGFDHVPPGGLPQPQPVGEYQSASQEAAPGASPVRLVPDPSMEFPAVPEAGPVGFERSVGAPDNGRFSSSYLEETEQAPDSGEASNDYHPAVRLAPNEEPTAPSAAQPAQAKVMSSDWNSRPASYEPMREPSQAKPKAPKKLVPFGIKKM